MKTESMFGSYHFGSFRNNGDELLRLRKQASIGSTFERNLWAAVGLKPNMRVLDAASGPGVISCELARAVPGGHVVGIELNPALLEAAEEHRRLLQITNISFRHGNVFNPPPDLGTFDFIYARFLFQHLSEPVRALKSLCQTLNPGGLICAVDVDDAFYAVYPEPPPLRPFMKLAAERQASKGGDRFVGRKLYSHFKAASVANVTQSVVTATSSDLGMEQFIEITTGYKHQLIASDSPDAMRAELDEIRNYSKSDGAWGAVGLFCCVGQRLL